MIAAVVRSAALLVFAVLQPMGTVSHAQDAPTRDGVNETPGRALAGMLRETARFRQNIFADGAGLDECSVRELVGDSAVVVDVFEAFVFPPGLLAGRSDGCSGRSHTESRDSGRRIVVADSAKVFGDSARVHLTVRQGEHIHRERYVLRRPPVPGVPMQASSVEIHGVLRLQRR